MKTRFHKILSVTAAISLIMCLCARAENPNPGWIDLGKLPMSSSGKEYVEVNIKGNLISMACKLVEKEEPQVASLLRGLKNIRVNYVGLDASNREIVTSKIVGLREELEKKEWERIVRVQQKSEDISVYMKIRGEDAVEGLVVTVLNQNSEAILVNIVGDIRPEQLSTIAERFHIEPLKKITKHLEDNSSQ